MKLKVKKAKVIFFELLHVTQQATDTTVALFNSCRPIETDSKGRRFIWIAYKPEGSGVWAKKQFC